MNKQLDAQELEKVPSCVSAEIKKLELVYGSGRPRLRLQILYDSRDKLLKQLKEIKEIKEKEKK